MGSQQPFPLSKLIFMFVKSLAQPLSRWQHLWYLYKDLNTIPGKVATTFTQFHIFHIVRRLLQRAKTDTLFRYSRKTAMLREAATNFFLQVAEFIFYVHRRLIVLPPAHLYHFYEAKIKFRVMNLGKVWTFFLLDMSFQSGRWNIFWKFDSDHCEQNSL